MSPHLRLWAFQTDRQIFKERLKGLTYEIVREQLEQPYSGQHDGISTDHIITLNLDNVDMKIFNPFSAGIDPRGQNLTSMDIRF